MALLESIDIPLGTEMPDFDLPAPNGARHTLTSTMGSHGLLIAFTCNHCPYAIAIWPRLIALAKQAKALGVETVAINPNINPDYPEDAPGKMLLKIKEWDISFPYLVDAAQGIAEAYKAQCTPDLYLLNAKQELVYHGRLDDNWKEPAKVTAHELADAIQNLASGKPINSRQNPSMGCSIKWKN
jgi:peroxiredoxin